MAACSEKSQEKCIPDYTEDKCKGVCRIKPEFIIDDHVRVLTEDCLSKEDKEKISQLTGSANDETDDEPAKKIAKLDSDNNHEVESANDNADEDDTEEPAVKKTKLDERREKLKGQNKARPRPFKLSRERSLCPWIVDQAVDEPEKKCPSAKCIFMHDRAAYLKIKEPEIDSLCYLFNLMGRCPRGTACRYASNHLTPEGLNIVDREKYEVFSKKGPATKNKIPMRVQEKLRKRKYDFNVAEKIVKFNEGSAAKKPCNEVKNTEDPKSEDKVEKRLGAVPDHDLIKLRPGEKKRIEWRDKILLSPLTTVGNLPFRRICKEYGADITCGEMALAPKILKGAHEEWALVKRHESEDLFGVQICGSNPGVLTRCAQLLNEQAEIDYVDLNLGCPIDLIYRHGGGSGMLNRLNVLENVVKSVSQVLDVPLTIKTRTGVYIDKPIAHNLMPKFREWGASMITVHGRSREQRYTKMADWEYIETCAKNADPIPVFGNGDILSYDDFQRVRSSHPSVQGITIGRGALIKPWIFSEIKEQKLYDISSSERLEILKKYANYGMEHWGSDTRGVETTRKFMLEWISFLHRYIPVGILEQPPQRINERPPFFKGRDEIETMMASSNCADWIKLTEMFLGKIPEGFRFLPKHKANSWK